MTKLDLKHSSTVAFTTTMALFAVACGEPAEQGNADAVACDDARAHVQACFPEQEARVPEGCDAAQAEEILAQDCDALGAEAQASEGKADGYCNPFFWWLCTSGGGSEREEVEGYTFNLGINVCQSETCVEDLFGEITSGAECGKITLHDAAGNVVATDYINDYLTWGGVQNTGEGFKNLDLEPGDYTARLWRRDGELATTVESEPAEIEISLLEDGGVEKSASNFRILASEADAVRACSDLQGSIATTCDGEPVEKEDAEWTWIMKIEGSNSEGTYENLKRSGFVYSLQTHSFLFPRVRPGSYRLTFIEVDVWSSYARDEYRNSKYEDYLELVERYETGLQYTETIEITEEDIAAGEVVMLPHVDLDSQLCL